MTINIDMIIMIVIISIILSLVIIIIIIKKFWCTDFTIYIIIIDLIEIKAY